MKMDPIWLVQSIFWMCLFNFVHVGPALSTLLESDSSVSDSLRSHLELRLAEATFDLLDIEGRLSRNRRPKRKQDGRSKRNEPNRQYEDWTAFVPRLHQHREQLAIKGISASILSPEWHCDASKSVRFDSAQNHQRTYAFGICDDVLTLYRVQESSLQFLQMHRLNGGILAMNHVKLYDPVQAKVELFLLVLCNSSFDVFVLEEDELENIYSQPLTKSYMPIVSVFYMETNVYYMLAKIESDQSVTLGIFKLHLYDGDFKADSILAKSLPDSSLVRVCVAGDDRAYVFADRRGHHRLNIYQFDGAKLGHHQIVETSSSVDEVQCFRMGASHYAAVVTSGTIRIFQQIESVYELVQVDAGPAGSLSVLPLWPETYRDETILLVRGIDPQTHGTFADLLVMDAMDLHFKSAIGSTCQRQDDWSATGTRSYDAADEGLSCLFGRSDSDWISSATGLMVDGRLGLIVPYNVSSDRKLVMLTFDVRLEPTSNPALEQKKQVARRIEQFTREMEELERQSQKLEQLLPNLVLYGSDVNLNGSKWTIGTLRVGRLNLTESDQVTSRDLNFNRDPWNPFFQVPVDDVQSRVDELEHLVDFLEKSMEDTIPAGTSDPIHFEQLVIQGSILTESLATDHLLVERINKASFNQVINDTVRRDSDRPIQGLKSFQGDVTTGWLAAQHINGVPVDQILKQDGLNRIMGDVSVRGPATIGNLTVGGQLAGLNDRPIGPEDVLAALNLTDEVSVDQLIVEGRLNGKEVDFFSKIVTNGSTGIELDGAKFQNLRIVGDVNVSGRLCGLDAAQLNQTVRLDGRNQEIVGSKTFVEPVVLEKSLKAGAVNRLKIPDHLVFRDAQVVLETYKLFQGPVNVRSVQLGGLINGRNLSDVVTLDTDQNIGAPILVDSVEAKGDLRVHKVNGHDYQSILERGINPVLLEQAFEGSVDFLGPVSVARTLHVDSTINDADFRRQIGDILYADESDPVITGTKKMASLEAHSLELAGTINGLDVMKDLLTTSTEQEIGANLELTGRVHLAALNASRLNGIDLEDLVDTWVRLNSSQPQIIKANLTFQDDIIVLDRLEIEGTLNGISTHQFLVDGLDQNFTAEQLLIDPTFQTLSVGGNLNLRSTTLNGIDVDQWDSRRVTISTDQDISARWRVGLIDAANATFQDLNGIPLRNWNDIFVVANSSVPQTVQGGLVVDALTVKGNLTTSQGLNGFQRWDLWKQSTWDVRQPVVLSTPVILERLESTGESRMPSVNGYELDSLAGDVVWAANPGPMEATKILSSVNVSGDVDVGLVNGGRLVDQYLHTKLDQVIESRIQFQAPVSARDLHFEDRATFNGIPSQSLFSAEHLPDNVHHGDVVFGRPVNVSVLTAGRINNESWNQLLDSLAWTNRSNRFQYPITLARLKVDGPLSVSLLNGVNLSHWADDLVLRDVDAEIAGPKNLTKVVAANLSAPRIQSVRMEPDLMATLERSIPLNATLELGLVFDEVEVRGDIRIGGLLNGFNLSADFISLKDRQEFSEPFTTFQLVLDGNVAMEPDARVNGWDLEAQYAGTWMADRASLLESRKVFQKGVEIKADLNVTRTINGFNMADQVVPLDANVTIYGAPILERLEVEGDVDAVRLTNDVDLKDLASRAVYSDQPLSTNGKWKADHVTVSGDGLLLTRRTRINGKAIKDLTGLEESSVDEANDELVQDRRQFDAAKEWYGAFRDAYFKLDYFDVDQTIGLPFKIASMHHTVVGWNVSLLLVGTQHCSSVLYCRKAGEDHYSFVALVNDTNSVAQWIPLQLFDSTDFVATVSKMAPACRHNTAKLWKIHSDPIRLELVQDFGTRVNDVFASNRTGNVQLIFTLGDVFKQWTVTNGQLEHISSRVLSNASVTRFGAEEAGYRSLTPHIKTHRFKVGEDELTAVLEPDSSVSGCSGVKIYRHHLKQIRLEHVISACNVRDMVTFSFGNLPDHFVILAERTSVGIYQYMGSSGFVRVSSLSIPAAQTLQWIQHGADHLLAVGRLDKIVIYKAVTLGHYVSD